MVYDTADADFTALQTAFLATTASAREIKIAAMDGDIPTTAGDPSAQGPLWRL